MSDQIGKAHAEKFKADYILRQQQKVSKFRQFVRDDPDRLDGKFVYFNRIGATAMQKRTSRHQDTLLVNTEHDRRRGTMEDFEWADLIDRQDGLRVLQNPTNSYVRNATYAARRNTDDVILKAAKADVVEVDEDGAETTVALPSDQKIVASSAGMTLNKMIEVQEKLFTSDVDEGMETVFAIGPKQNTDMLKIAEIKSIDYNGGKPLTEGQVTTFMGFTFIMTNRLEKSGSDRLCLAWRKEGIGFSLGEELFVDVGPRRDKGMATQVYLAQTMGGVRIEDELVVQVACQE